MIGNMPGFSRPHLIKLLESGAIPFQKVGQHRRVMMKDVLAFQLDKDRKDALSELAREAVQDGFYEGTGIPKGENDD